MTGTTDLTRPHTDHSAPVATGRRSLLVFRLPGHVCALPVEAVREVVPLARLGRPPSLPAVLEGFLDLGGQAVAVLRLDHLLGLPEVKPGLYTPLVVLRSPEDCLALLVESVLGLRTVADAAVRPVAPNLSFNDCVEGEFALEEGVAHLLAPDRLLLEKERQCLAEFQAVEQQRLRRLAGPAGEEGEP